jgi:hypothetical protein
MSFACERARTREAFVIDHSTLLVVINGAFGATFGDLGLLLGRLAHFVRLVTFCSALLTFLQLDFRKELVMHDERLGDYTVPSLSAILPFTHFFPERISLQLPDCA